METRSDLRLGRRIPTVGDLMQRDVVTLDAAANLDVAERLMRSDRIRHLPIVSGNHLVGLLSQRDVLRAGLSGVPPRCSGVPLAHLSVREAMTTQVHVSLPESTLASAVEMMLLKDIGCLPVVEGKRVVGLLTRTDCLRHLLELLTAS
jgi:CBS domain-containing protein